MKPTGGALKRALFPRTEVEGISLPRMLIGSNWMMGYSHTSQAADDNICRLNRNPQAVADIITAFAESGVDALMGGVSREQTLRDGLELAEQRLGRKIIRIDTPVLNVDDTPEARREALAAIRFSRECGAAICMPHHTCVEQLVCKNTQTINRLPDYLAMIRDEGMVPGLSAHMPECIVYSDQNEYDVQTYIQIYNCAGFMMQVEIEYIHKVIHAAKKPVMTIKPMAAGRVSPFVGLSFAYATLRERDMVTVGCMTPGEAREDVEFGLAAIERRAPGTPGRGSFHKTAVMK